MGKVVLFRDDMQVDSALLDRLDRIAAARIEERPAPAWISDPIDEETLHAPGAARTSHPVRVRKYRW